MHEIPNESIIYASARIEQWIKDYAESNAYSEYELTLRVAASLYEQANGKISRAIHNLSSLRSQTTKGNKTTRSLALAKRTYRKAQRPLVSKRLGGPSKGFKYPKGTHWTQKPENKARLRNIAQNRRAA